MVLLNTRISWWIDTISWLVMWVRKILCADQVRRREPGYTCVPAKQSSMVALMLRAEASGYEFVFFAVQSRLVT